MEKTLLMSFINKGEELSRIVGVLRRLNFEICELVLKKTEYQELYRMRITVKEKSDGHCVEYLQKQLSKIINITQISLEKGISTAEKIGPVSSTEPEGVTVEQFNCF